ncbi:MAG: cupin domain-containing protein [Haloarculaceae archaeon]
MERVAVEAVETGDRPNATVRGLADELGTTDVAINHYHLEPGEAFASGMHTHVDQEEVFYVIEGEATFETPEGETAVGAGEAVRFAPGDYQQGRNEGDEPVEALALGAPRESTDVRIPQPCPECGESDNLRAIPTDEGFAFECPECGADVELGA